MFYFSHVIKTETAMKKSITYSQVKSQLKSGSRILQDGSFTITIKMKSGDVKVFEKDSNWMV